MALLTSAATALRRGQNDGLCVRARGRCCPRRREVHAPAHEFDVNQAGTFFYHSHKEPDRQQALGMYGALIVDPADDAIDEAYDYQ